MEDLLLYRGPTNKLFSSKIHVGPKFRKLSLRRVLDFFQLATFPTSSIFFVEDLSVTCIQILVSRKFKQEVMERGHYAQYTPPTPTGRNCFVASASAV